MGKLVKLFGFTMAVSLLSAPLVSAEYTEGAPGDATLTGKVSFKGAQPPPMTFDLAKFPQAEFCGKVDAKDGKRIRQDVRVKDGGLGDAVVYIEKIEKGKPFKEKMAKVVADGCRFMVDGGVSKSVGVVIKKGDISFTNNDADPSEPKSAEGVLHNPHGYEIIGAKSTTTFNKPLPKKGQTITEKIKPINFKKEDSFMKVECDQHNYMNVWFLPVESPYYAVVNDDGTFSIDQVPAGKYQVIAFHPSLGFQKQEVEVKGQAKANFEFAGK